MTYIPTNPIEVSEEAGLRYLHFGSEWIQGAMRVRRPFALELEYTRLMTAGLLFRTEPWPKRVLMIGLGAGSLAKYFHRFVPQCKVTVVEIDPRVVQVARASFRLPDEDARLAIVIGDGAEYITRRSSYWDAILVDGFDHKANAGELTTEPFYLNCRAALTPRGLASFNLFGQRRSYKAQLLGLMSAFEGEVLALPMCESGNIVAFAHGAEEVSIDSPTLHDRADTLRTATGLDLRQLAKSLDLTSTGICF